VDRRLQHGVEPVGERPLLPEARHALVEAGDLRHPAPEDHDVGVEDVEDDGEGAGHPVLVALEGGEGGRLSLLRAGDDLRGSGLLARRLAGEPLQYVLGEWAFREHDLLVDRRVLIPRPETETVVEVALAEVERLGERRGRPDPWAAAITTFAVADLGTGSGAIAIALERSLPEAEVWATDRSAEALAVARANIAGTGATRVRTAEGHWFEALDDSLRGELLLVVSNPPYIAEAEIDALPAAVIEWEPFGALVSGPTGLEAIGTILAEAPGWLAPGGVVVLEHAPHQADAVVDLARDAGFVEARVEPDLAGRPRALVARLA